MADVGFELHVVHVDAGILRSQKSCAIIWVQPDKRTAALQRDIALPALHVDVGHPDIVTAHEPDPDEPVLKTDIGNIHAARPRDINQRAGRNRVSLAEHVEVS